jgi:DNA-binding XRE family transcriptional regulator
MRLIDREIGGGEGIADADRRLRFIPYSVDSGLNHLIAPGLTRHVGEQIKKRRFDLKLPAHECQKLLGVDKSTLTAWEAGKHKPSRANRAKILQFITHSFDVNDTSPAALRSGLVV